MKGLGSQVGSSWSAETVCLPSPGLATIVKTVLKEEFDILESRFVSLLRVWWEDEYNSALIIRYEATLSCA